MTTGWYIGRFQPFHKGHQACIEEILKECDKCIVIIKEAEKSKNNPYSSSEVKNMIEEWVIKTKNNVSVQIIKGDSENMTVYYGRDVGWGFKKLTLPKEIEAISATKIRELL